MFLYTCIELIIYAQSNSERCKCNCMIPCQIPSVNASNYHKNLHAGLKSNTSTPYNKKLYAKMKQTIFIEGPSEILVTMLTPSTQIHSKNNPFQIWKCVVKTSSHIHTPVHKKLCQIYSLPWRSTGIIFPIWLRDIGIFWEIDEVGVVIIQKYYPTYLAKKNCYENTHVWDMAKKFDIGTKKVLPSKALEPRFSIHSLRL